LSLLAPLNFCSLSKLVIDLSKPFLVTYQDSTLFDEKIVLLLPASISALCSGYDPFKCCHKGTPSSNCPLSDADAVAGGTKVGNIVLGCVFSLTSFFPSGFLSQFSCSFFET